MFLVSMNGWQKTANSCVMGILINFTARCKTYFSFRLEYAAIRGRGVPRSCRDPSCGRVEARG